jgi:hypothetical protein
MITDADGQVEFWLFDYTELDYRYHGFWILRKADTYGIPEQVANIRVGEDFEGINFSPLLSSGGQSAYQICSGGNEDQKVAFIYNRRINPHQFPKEKQGIFWITSLFRFFTETEPYSRVTIQLLEFRKAPVDCYNAPIRSCLDEDLID